jgi:zinc transport system permease protein
MPTGWLDDLIQAITRLAPPETFLSWSFNVRGLIAVVLVSLICGAVGSLVVCNRMAFFSDALAHCALAGVSLGFLTAIFAGVHDRESFYEWIVTIMVIFGMIVGVSIAFVRERTGLASDTVIGVFFAGAIGFGAMLIKAVSTRAYFSLETILFGDLITVTTQDLVILLLLGLLTAGLLAAMYNSIVFASFNPSLARSRRIPVRVCNYLLILLLALIVNLSIRAVGALLINGLLIVPAAAAANVCRNMRQLFWGTVGLCLLAGVLGQWLSFEVKLPVSAGEPLSFGSAGTIVVLCVLFFFLSMVLGPRIRGQQAT